MRPPPTLWVAHRVAGCLEGDLQVRGPCPLLRQLDATPRPFGGREKGVGNRVVGGGGNHGEGSAGVFFTPLSVQQSSRARLVPIRILSQRENADGFRKCVVRGRIFPRALVWGIDGAALIWPQRVRLGRGGLEVYATGGFPLLDRGAKFLLQDLGGQGRGGHRGGHRRDPSSGGGDHQPFKFGGKIQDAGISWTPPRFPSHASTTKGLGVVWQVELSRATCLGMS